MMHFYTHACCHRALIFLVALGALAPLALSVATPTAHAQEEEQLIQIIVMDVPGGGTKTVAKQLILIENVRPYPDQWFFKKVTERGLQTEGLLENSKDLKWSMERVGIALLIDFTYDDETELYTVYFYSPESGKVVKTFDVASDEDGITQEAAQKIRKEVEGFLKGPDPAATPAPEPGEEEVMDPEALRKAAMEAEKQKRANLPSDWLQAAVQFRLTKHDFLFGAQNSAITTSYVSGFYPGYDINAEVFPLVFTGGDVTAVGFYTQFNQGFDQVKSSVIDASGQPAEIIFKVNQLQFEGGVSYRLDTPRKTESTGKFIRARLRLGVRYLLNKVDDPDEFGLVPSISLTNVVVGGKVSYPIFSTLSLHGALNFIPWGSFGQGSAAFGTPTYTYGMGSMFGGVYMFTENLGGTLNYNFDLYRTSFEGATDAMTGIKLFEKADAFDFYQGIAAGVHIQY